MLSHFPIGREEGGNEVALPLLHTNLQEPEPVHTPSHRIRISASPISYDTRVEEERNKERPREKDHTQKRKGMGKKKKKTEER